MTNLDDGATRLMDVARVDARRRGHEEVLPEHVFVAALALPEGYVVANRRGIDVKRLREALEAKLAGFPMVAGYRDVGHDLPTSGALAQVLDVAARRRRRVWFWQQRLRAIDVIVACFSAPRFATVLADSEFDLEPVQKLYDAALALARERRHRLLVDHAILALFDLDPTFAEAFRVVGHDPKVVRTRIDSRLTPTLRSHYLNSLEGLVNFASSRANLAAGDIGLGIIVVDLLRQPSVRAAIEAADVNRYELLYAYVHGRALEPASLDRREGVVDVVLYDDPYTTMAFVLEVLQRMFGLDEAAAREKTLAVHETGSAVVATLARDVATAGVIRARGAARDQLMPLRIELVSAQASDEVSMTNR